MAASASCVFFAQGRCRNGDACPFSHDGARPICVFYNSTGCNNGAACPFRHEGRPATPPAERWRRQQDEITRVLEQQAARNREALERQAQALERRAAKRAAEAAVTCEICHQLPPPKEDPQKYLVLSSECCKCEKVVCWSCAVEDEDSGRHCRACWEESRCAYCQYEEAHDKCEVCKKPVCMMNCMLHINPSWINCMDICKRCWRERPPIDFAARRFGAASDEDLGASDGESVFGSEDLPTPPIVTAAGYGQLERVRSIVERATQRGPEFARAIMNAAGAWQEVEEKWGYDKTWEWHGQTALAKACSQKRHAVVHYLLSVGADPYLKAMVHCDQSENAFESAKYCPISTALLQAAKPFWAGSNVSPSYSRRLTYRTPTDAAALRRALDKVYAPHLARRSRPAAYDDEDEEDDDDDDDDDDPDGLQGVDWTSVPDSVRRLMEARQLARAAHARRQAWEAQNPELARQMRETEQHLRDTGYTAEAAVPAQRQAKNKRKSGANPPSERGVAAAGAKNNTT
jgi:hypothetical protein